MSASAKNSNSPNLFSALICGVTLGLVVCVFPASAQVNVVSAARVNELIAQVKSKAPDEMVLKNAREVGQFLLNEKRYAEAAQLFEALVEKQPRNALALYGAALATFNLGTPAEAEPIARAAVEAINSASAGFSNASREQRGQAADALVLLAVIVAVRGDDQQSLKIAESAVTIAPDHFDAQFTLGRALYSAGDPIRAAQAFRTAVSLNPTDPRALFFLGTTLEQAGDLEGAVRSYRQLVLNQPLAAEGHLGLGIVLVKRGEVNEGVKELERALVIEPNLYEAQVTIGRSLVAQGRPAESLDHLIRAAQLAPGNPEPHYQLSLAYRRLGRNDKAAEESEVVRRIHESRRAGPATSNTQKQPE